MKTYQDLLKVGESEIAKALFCRVAVNDFQHSREYAEAKAGESYYAKHNLTIENYQKMLFTLSGNQVQDIFSANYKLKTLFFRRLTTQQVQYVLGNGLKLGDDANKEKLGRDFDFQLQRCATKAMAGGRAFGYWNLDHLEVFGFADTDKEAGFCPLYNEDTAQLDAGIRFWFKQVGDKLLFRSTLYEKDGYTEFKQVNSDLPEVLQSKKGYKTVVTKSKARGVENVLEENYSALPIVPLYANDTYESELVGIRECIDCYDFIKSGLANEIDDTSGFFWILENTGGMDDVDLAQFIQRMKTVRGAVVDGDQGVNATPHTMDIPVNARQLMLEILRKDIYEDFQALDVNTLSASAKTTQEIQASYQSQDNKCANFEYYILDFVQQILELAGIDDNPTLQWNKVANQLEQTQMILQSAEYLTDEVIIKHLPFLTPEEADDLIQQREEEEYDQFSDEEEELEEEPDTLDDEEDLEVENELDELLRELEG